MNFLLSQKRVGFLLICLALPLMAYAQTDQTALPAPSTTPTVFDNPELVQRYQATITPEDLASHLYFFASDFFEGRETGARGQKMAAEYLAAQYRRLGIQPRGNTETADPRSPQNYLQPFEVYGSRLQRSELSVSVNGQEVATSFFSPDRQAGGAYIDTRINFRTKPALASSGGVVFMGYGIADSSLGIHDIGAVQAAGIETAGKWVMLFRDEPLANDSTSLLPTEDGKPSRFTTSFFQKMIPFLRGVPTSGMLIVGDVGPRVDQSVEDRAAMIGGNLSRAMGSLSLNEQDRPESPPLFVISTEMANQILAPSGRTVADLKEEIDNNLESVVFEVEGTTVSSEVEMDDFAASTENVLAYIEGSDPVLKNEFVVISSHYDHIGIDPFRSGDNLRNGADDDGSGTVGVLEIAEAFARAKEDGYGPRRSILFLNVSGEEKGLLGSRYFTDFEPLVSLDQIVTNLNIDMIGRFDPTHPTQSTNYIDIIGSNLISQELHDINEQVNEITGVNLELSERFNSRDDPNRFYARSDHANFGKNMIPFIFYFNGTHEDYHGVDDEPHKIEYERMARVGQLIFATAWQVANQDNRPEITGTGFN